MEILKHVIGRCSKCNDVLAMAVADTPEEMADALKSAADWAKSGMSIDTITHVKGQEPPPAWCECPRGSK